MGAPARLRKLSLNEYLDLEKRSPVRHEYVAGNIFAMAGGSRAHNRIAINLVKALDTHLGGSGCEVFINDVKTRVEAADAVYYPDLVVTCAKDDRDKYMVEKATLVIEILSPTTEGVDRREKAMNYALIDTLQEYIIVGQEIRRVEILRRSQNWEREVIEGDGVLRFESVGLEIPLAEIYRGV